MLTILIGREPETRIYTPLSKKTNSDQVLQLAKFWIRKCLSQEHEKCPDANFNNRRTRYWPTRLIELPPYDPTVRDENSGKMRRVRLIRGQDAAKFADDEEKLRLVYMDLKPPRGHRSNLHTTLPGTGLSKSNIGLSRTETLNDAGLDSVAKRDQLPWQYVTLSHCWGKQHIARLEKGIMGDLDEQGTPIEFQLDSLPTTFRDAIEFARRLDSKVRYIWIDSLCIIQNEDDNTDWRRESTLMYEVYRNSYCNISAAAAKDSTVGIHNKSERDPQLLWEDEINLNIDGIPGAQARRSDKNEIGLEAPIRRCTIRDLSFWDREVDDAPVNKRAWVLQERLLAPRVLHFCRDQIAWECSHLDAAESLPHGVPKMELRPGHSGHVIQRQRLKSMVPDDYGPRPLEIDRDQMSDAAHEHWKWIVERYSRTRLTYGEDKLVALAGIAQMMTNPGRISGLYVAGMWEKYLASQLLWRVSHVDSGSVNDPTYEDPIEKDEVREAGRKPDLQRFSNWSKRPRRYRAPSFSWAAVDAPQGVRLGARGSNNPLDSVVGIK